MKVPVGENPCRRKLREKYLAWTLRSYFDSSTVKIPLSSSNPFIHVIGFVKQSSLSSQIAIIWDIQNDFCCKLYCIFAELGLTPSLEFMHALSEAAKMMTAQHGQKGWSCAIACVGQTKTSYRRPRSRRRHVPLFFMTPRTPPRAILKDISWSITQSSVSWRTPRLAEDRGSYHPVSILFERKSEADAQR